MKPSARPIGQLWLREHYQLPTPAAAVESYVGSTSRMTRITGAQTSEMYPLRYAVDDTLEGHLRFAMRYEPLDMGVISGVMRAAAQTEVLEWLTREPTSQYARRAWFLYERFSGHIIDIPLPATRNWVAALDVDLQLVGPARRSARHHVIDNLLGNERLCVTVRKSERLVSAIASRDALRAKAQSVISAHDASVLRRASSYLYTKETRSTFAIERESPTPMRAERFVRALHAAATFAPDIESLVKLQQTIVEPRYAESSFRQSQNFVGETLGNDRERIHFICPKPEDVDDLMRGLRELFTLLANTQTDPVVAAAIVAFAFVFIHPFEDGNGRIHRFLLHAMLARHAFTPEGIIFPVSAIMERERRAYDDVLESFSKALFEWIDYDVIQGTRLLVRNATDHLYRFFDATAMAEYVYECITKTIDKDLIEELDYLTRFDAARSAVRSIVDMPDQRLTLFVKLVLQNNGVLSAAKRAQFVELTDEELSAMQLAVKAAE
ncbi:MAG: Fic family protein [Clostridia bacterium]|nr:Fic family protein [Deltaproteobacteria bacterium]